MLISRLTTICVTGLSLLLFFLPAGCGNKMHVVKTRLIAAPDHEVEPEQNAVSENHFDKPGLSAAVELYRTGKHEAARDRLEQMLWEGPCGWEVYYYLGLAHTGCSQYQLADARLTASLDLGPNDRIARSMVYLALGENHELQGDLGRARQNYLTALNLHPQSVAVAEALKRLGPLSQVKN